MSSSKECLNSSSGANCSKTSPESSDRSVPTSYIQIQNELTPARSPGSCKVRFSEKTPKFTEPPYSIEENRSRQVAPKSLPNNETKYEKQRNFQML